MLLNEFKTIGNEDDFEYNLDKWKDNQIRVLFITGLSGSGKSTLGKEIAKKHNAKYIELDRVVDTDFARINYVDYIGDIEKINSMTQKEYSSSVSDFIFGLYPSKQLVVEGISFLEWYDGIPNLENYAIIIKGTSRLTSVLRSAKRDELPLPTSLKLIFRNNNAYKYHKQRADSLMRRLNRK